jgi:methionine biosynthesis protein MetW
LIETTYKYDGFNELIFRLVPRDKKVLDVGCATGKLGEKLIKAKGCYVAGIEIDSKMANVAESRCSKLLEMDIEDATELPFPDEFFDIIVFADSLEHMKQPSTVLAALTKYLSADGHLLLSIPNVALFSTRLGILQGKFDYGEYGVLDKTHLRFFTLKTARKLVQDAGFEIMSVRGYSAVRNRYYVIKRLANVWKTMFAADFVIDAIRSEVARKENDATFDDLEPPPKMSEAPTVSST